MKCTKGIILQITHATVNMTPDCFKVNLSLQKLSCFQICESNQSVVHTVPVYSRLMPKRSGLSSYLFRIICLFTVRPPDETLVNRHDMVRLVYTVPALLWWADMVRLVYTVPALLWWADMVRLVYTVPASLWWADMVRLVYTVPALLWWADMERLYK